VTFTAVDPCFTFGRQMGRNRIADNAIKCFISHQEDTVNGTQIDIRGEL